MQSTAGKFVLSMICFGVNPPRFGYEVNLFIDFLFFAMNPLDSISLTIHSFSPSHTLQSMPESVFDKISSSKLVFVKGDANYRRLLVRRMIMRSSLLGFYSSLFLFH